MNDETVNDETMSNEKDGSRKYDAANPAALAKFMKTGWAPTPLEGIIASEAIPFCKARIEKLSKKLKNAEEKEININENLERIKH